MSDSLSPDIRQDEDGLTITSPTWFAFLSEIPPYSKNTVTNEAGEEGQFSITRSGNTYLIYSDFLKGPTTFTMQTTPFISFMCDV